jgi:hypothetical protein
MFMYFYKGYESRPFATEAEAEEAFTEIEAEIASIYGYCDHDYMEFAEVDE